MYYPNLETTHNTFEFNWLELIKEYVYILGEAPILCPNSEREEQ